MKLYYNPISTYSQKVLLAFYEKGLEFQPKIIKLMDPESNEEYRKIYPMGKIPCLVLEDDHIIPESSIIIEYIDSMAEPRLIDGDAEQTRKIRFKDRMFDLYLNDTVVTLLFQSMKPDDQKDQEKIDTAKFRIDTMYNFMDHEFGQQPYANGDTFTMSDCSASPALFYSELLTPFTEYKNICAYWERLKERASVQRTHKDAKPIVEEFMRKNAA